MILYYTFHNIEHHQKEYRGRSNTNKMEQIDSNADPDIPVPQYFPGELQKKQAEKLKSREMKDEGEGLLKDG